MDQTDLAAELEQAAQGERYGEGHDARPRLRGLVPFVKLGQVESDADGQQQRLLVRALRGVAGDELSAGISSPAGGRGEPPRIL